MLKGGRLAGVDLSGYPGRSTGQEPKRRDSGEENGSDSEQSDGKAGGSRKSKGKGKDKKKSGAR